MEISGLLAYSGLVKRMSLKSIFGSWLQSPHLRPIGHLASGSAVAQVIALLATPIVTRLYLPSEYGTAALFMSIVTVVATVAALRYEVAISIPPETSEGERDAIALVRVSLVAIAAVCTLTLLVTAVGANLGEFQVLEDLGYWVYAIPVGVFLSSLSLTLNSFAIRCRQYSIVARVAPLQKMVTAGLQIAGGLAKLGTSGLMVAALATPVVGLAVLWRTYRLGLSMASEASDRARARMRRVAVKYRDFPFVSTWFALLNALAWNIQALVIGHYFSTAEVGQYALAVAMISLPTGLVLTGVSQVYSRECASRASDTSAVLRLARKMVASLAIVSIPLFLFLLLVSAYLFGLVFGPNWEQAGAIGVAMIPLLWARFLTTSLTTTLNVYRRQGLLLAWQVLALAATLGALVWGGQQGLGVVDVTWLMSALTAPAYLMILPLTFWAIRRGPRLDARDG